MLSAQLPCHLLQWSPTFLAPEIGFAEDNFFTVGGELV